jgi:hypothetical protein
VSRPHEATTPARHWLPSIPATVFVGVLAFVIFGFQEPLLNSDGDLARHLRHGEWMLQHHRLITADPFSYTKGGQPFVAFEYGSQLAYALAHRVGGLAAVTVLAALLIAAAYALITRFMLRRGVEPLLAGLVTTAAIITGMGHWLARPHLFTLVAVPLLLELLSPVGQWRYWPFAILFAVWVNLHGGFVYGLVLIGIFLAAAVIDALRSSGGPWRSAAVRRYAGALGLGAASALANPWGVGVYRHIVSMFGDHYIIDHTAEFASPDFHDLASKFFLILLVAVMAAAFLNRRAPTVTVLMTVAGVYLALVHQRNATLFGLTALPLVAMHLDPAWRSARFLGKLRRGAEAGAKGASTAAWVGAVSALAIALGAAHGRVGSRQWVGNAFSPERLPMAAVAAARSAGLTGRVFSDFGWGGYLLYAWPEQKVFIDGGTDFYGGDLMRNYGIIRTIEPGWWDLVRQWNFALMIVSPEAPIASELTRDHGWRYWYCDRTAVVLLRGDVVAPPPRTGSPSPEACAPEKGGEIGAS